MYNRYPLPTIGASTLPAIVGVSDFASATPFSAYKKLMGLEKPPPITSAQGIAMSLGVTLEPWVLEQYMATTGAMLLKRGPTLEEEPIYLTSRMGQAQQPVFHARPDAFVKRRNIERCLEIKTTSKEFEGVPEKYKLQVQLQMAASGLPLCDVAIFYIPDKKLSIYELEYDPEYLHAYLDEAEAWWIKHILEQDLPLAWRASLSESVRSEMTATQKVASDEEISLFYEYTSVSKTIKELEKRKDEIKEFLRGTLAPGEFLEWQNKKLFYWTKGRGGWSIDEDKLAREYPEALQACKYERKGDPILTAGRSKK